MTTATDALMVDWITVRRLLRNAQVTPHALYEDGVAPADREAALEVWKMLRDFRRSEEGIDG